MLCSVEGCGVETRVLYWCEKHYRRRRRYGDPCYMHSLVCGWCGVEFEAWSSARRFCSDRCRDASRVDRSGLTCVGCGKSMWRGRTSRDTGEATCLDCRRGAPTYKPRKPVSTPCARFSASAPGAGPRSCRLGPTSVFAVGTAAAARTISGCRRADTPEMTTGRVLCLLRSM